MILWTAVAVAALPALAAAYLLQARLFRRRIGRISWPVAAVLKRSGGCYRCRTSWLFVRRHVVPYDVGRGITPCCEGCWDEMDLEHRWLVTARFLMDWQDAMANSGRRDEVDRIRISAVSVQAAIKAGA